jgi:hypothetical protein
MLQSNLPFYAFITFVWFCLCLIWWTWFYFLDHHDFLFFYWTFVSCYALFRVTFFSLFGFWFLDSFLNWRWTSLSLFWMWFSLSWEKISLFQLKLNHTQTQRQRSPSPIQERIQKPKTKQRKECNPEKGIARNKCPVKEQEIMVIKEVKPGPSNKAQAKSYKCNECIKWEIRLQHCLRKWQYKSVGPYK